MNTGGHFPEQEAQIAAELLQQFYFLEKQLEAMAKPILPLRILPYSKDYIFVCRQIIAFTNPVLKTLFKCKNGVWYA